MKETPKLIKGGRPPLIYKPVFMARRIAKLFYKLQGVS